MFKRWMVTLAAVLAVPLSGPAGPRGSLFIVGGGDWPTGMMERFVELASRFQSGRIVIFPMASSVPEEVGPEEAAEFSSLGAAAVQVFNLSREEALREDSVRIIEDAGGVFFSGGDQSRLADVLVGTPLHRGLLSFYERGGVVGGTSAGAAVMSEVMITGDEKRQVEEGHEFETITAGNIVTRPGFGFLRSAIIDQHFVRRKRHNRLISLVIEKPDLLGIGIDEETAVLVRPDRKCEVIGTGCVIVLDAQNADIDIGDDGTVHAAGMRMHVLKAGDLFDLESRTAVEK